VLLCSPPKQTRRRTDAERAAAAGEAAEIERDGAPATDNEVGTGLVVAAAGEKGAGEPATDSEVSVGLARKVHNVLWVVLKPVLLCPPPKQTRRRTDAESAVAAGEAAEIEKDGAPATDNKVGVGLVVAAAGEKGAGEPATDSEVSVGLARKVRGVTCRADRVVLEPVLLCPPPQQTRRRTDAECATAAGAAAEIEESGAPATDSEVGTGLVAAATAAVVVLGISWTPPNQTCFMCRRTGWGM
jgi:hypothetical protein